MNQPDLAEVWSNPPRARRTDPETSHMAAEKAAPRASKGRLLVLQHLIEFGPMTDFDLAHATGLQQTSIGVRRGECVKAGLVCALIEGGKVVMGRSPTNSPARVWTVTPAGCAHYAEHGKREHG